MDGEFTYKPNFTVVDHKSSKFKPESKNNKQSKDNANTLEHSSVLDPNEVGFIQKKRHKIRIFDPEGIYTFRHIEISYFQSFLHTLSMLISLFLIISFYYFVITDTQKFVTDLGRVSDINTLDKLCMFFIALYSLLKIKKTITTKVTNFNKRYCIAICANSLNTIVLNYLKLIFFFLVIILTIIQREYPEKTVSFAFNLFENGVLADTLSIITWFITIMIVIKAFKYCGKGEIK